MALLVFVRKAWLHTHDTGNSEAEQRPSLPCRGRLLRDRIRPTRGALLTLFPLLESLDVHHLPCRRQRLC
jgi:hypothetical protein